MKGFSEVVRDYAIIVLGIFLVLGLFTFQNFMENFNDEIKKGNSLSGKAIGISSPGATDPGIVINGSGGVKPSLPPPKVGEKHENLDCLRSGGVNEGDIEITGNLLKGMPCGEKEKKEISAKIEDGCLKISFEDELDTFICKDEETGIKINLEVPVLKMGSVPVFTKRQYNGLILFIFFLIVVLIVWREFEMREKKLAERRREKQRHLELPKETIEIKVIKSAPLFKEKVSEEERRLSSEEAEIVHSRLVAEQKKLVSTEPIDVGKVSEYIKQFNLLGKEVGRYLHEGKLVKAGKRYLHLFPIYTRLYESVDSERRRQLVEVIKYLHDQINIMEKSRKIRHLIEEAYSGVEDHKVDKKKGGVKSFEEVKNAEKLFSQLGGEAKKKKELKKENVYEEIEKIHEKVKDKDKKTKNLRDLEKELEKLKELVYGERK